MPVSPHTLERQAPHAGLSYQGRLEEHPAAAEPCSEFLEDKQEQCDEDWLQVFKWGAISLTAGWVGLLLFLFRGA